ncbi:YrhK-like protein [Lentibacillus persicus]|uniref:YrhK-like protein n=1 Tax=Lentibacillus persicus TaxID=640948 RepID=A0A1I1Z488_9BACI|nr:YrhK family protein [Lentibacillus persicus]SFE26529.1 YrhK-like protein [Lentibacillus persicus]
MPRIFHGKKYHDLKAGRFRLYFRRKYRLISLSNDLLIGFFFITGSILNFFTATASFGSIAYLLGSIFLASRPILKIIHNTGLKDDYKETPR